jgi:type IV pilus assembly protein PilM
MRLGERRTPIGLDLGTHSLKAVQLAGRGTSCRAVAVASIPRSKPGSSLDQSDLLRLSETLQRQGFNGREVIVAVPPSQLRTGMLELPARSSDVPMDEIARSEFCRITRCDPAEALISYWELPAPARASRATYAMAVGCNGPDADQWIDLIQGVGLEVVAMDANGSALARSCQPVAAAEPDLTAILDVGWSCCAMVITKSGQVIYERRIAESGLSGLVQTLAKDNELSADDANNLLHSVGLRCARAEDVDMDCRASAATHFARTFDELRQSLNYAAHQYPDAARPLLLLCGGGARIAGLAEFIEGEMHLKVRTVEAADVLSAPPSLGRTMTTTMLSAIGLARFAGQ